MLAIAVAMEPLFAETIPTPNFQHVTHTIFGLFLEGIWNLKELGGVQDEKVVMDCFPRHS